MAGLVPAIYAVLPQIRARIGVTRLNADIFGEAIKGC
jgi:hypothetical protein